MNEQESGTGNGMKWSVVSYLLVPHVWEGVLHTLRSPEKLKTFRYINMFSAVNTWNSKSAIPLTTSTCSCAVQIIWAQQNRRVLQKNYYDYFNTKFHILNFTTYKIYLFLYVFNLWRIYIYIYRKMWNNLYYHLTALHTSHKVHSSLSKLRTYSANRPIHMVLEWKHVPSLIFQTWFQFLNVESFQNVRIFELGIGSSDGCF